ncbi:MAG: hypothetical protein NTZ60_07600 [Campylobacterales bacterium]|nr:hypothetical protein [Campylobacterales bacterium]
MNMSIKADIAYSNHTVYSKYENATTTSNVEQTDGLVVLSGDRVEISQEARKLTISISVAIPSMYAQYFPTRDGEPANALADAVSNPSLQTFSKDKNFGQVAKDARTELDAQYALMKKSGKLFDTNSNEGEDWHSVFQNFDRRALYGVSSNEGGSFSKEEQDMASSLMSQQQGLAMGLYSGPTRLEDSFTDQFSGDIAAKMKEAVAFLNNVSAEEKSSGTWMSSITTAQNTYEYLANHKDEKRADDDENLLVKWLLKADKEVTKKMLEDSKKLSSTLKVSLSVENTKSE